MSFSFRPLRLPGLILAKPQIFPDERGFLTETYKRSIFATQGINVEFAQDMHSFSTKGVLRGLHYQMSPCAQGKLVHVVGGIIWDVVVDIRPESPSYGKWEGIELSEENRYMLWIPPGFAHGFVVLSEAALVVYKCSTEYSKPHERGIRWNDTAIDIRWPITDVIMSDKDRILPLFSTLSEV
jgi:dTDP-4-dehydrorhamnose 3,5-epimerase